MKTTRTMEDAKSVQHDEWYADDPLSLIAADCPVLATVSSVVGRSLAYGELKCSTTVTLQCAQSSDTVHQAGVMAFNKARELTNAGMKLLAPDAGDI